MKLRHSTTVPILLGLALTQPMMAVFAAAQQKTCAEHANATQGRETDRPAQESAQEEDAVERVYDRDHRDYHRWDNAEERAYRSFWEEHHRAYRPYSSLNRREQSHYWKWRHAAQDQASMFPVSPAKSPTSSPNK
jgi:hypothetical protein